MSTVVYIRHCMSYNTHYVNFRRLYIRPCASSGLFYRACRMSHNLWTIIATFKASRRSGPRIAAKQRPHGLAVAGPRKPSRQDRPHGPEGQGLGPLYPPDQPGSS